MTGRAKRDFGDLPQEVYGSVLGASHGFNAKLRIGTELDLERRAQPNGDATRLDPFRGRLAGELLERLALADEDPDLGEALDRWELSLFQTGPWREEQLREALTALLGGADGVWAASMRASVLLGERIEEPRPDTVRRALVEMLMHGDRAALVTALDETMLGLREAPAGYFARVAS